ncbi:MAG: hypothetical protein Q7R52_04920 [archaeon]|nr:hypothetical protein [archaeon]
MKRGKKKKLFVFLIILILVCAIGIFILNKYNFTGKATANKPVVNDCISNSYICGDIDGSGARISCEKLNKDYVGDIDLDKACDSSGMAGCCKEKITEKIVAENPVNEYGKIQYIDMSDKNHLYSWKWCDDREINDGGMNYEVKGKIKAAYDKAGFWGSSQKTKRYEDSCLNSSYLREYFCQGTGAYFIDKYCKYGCDKSTCKSLGQTYTGKIYITTNLIGDFNNDNCVNQEDINEFNQHINSKTGDEKYDKKYDLFLDEKIDSIDLLIFLPLAKNNLCSFNDSEKFSINGCINGDKENCNEISDENIKNIFIEDYNARYEPEKCLDDSCRKKAALLSKYFVEDLSNGVGKIIEDELPIYECDEVVCYAKETTSEAVIDAKIVGSTDDYGNCGKFPEEYLEYCKGYRLSLNPSQKLSLSGDFSRFVDEKVSSNNMRWYIIPFGSFDINNPYFIVDDDRLFKDETSYLKELETKGIVIKDNFGFLMKGNINNFQFCNVKKGQKYFILLETRNIDSFTTEYDFRQLFSEEPGIIENPDSISIKDRKGLKFIQGIGLVGQRVDFIQVEMTGNSTCSYSSGSGGYSGGGGFGGGSSGSGDNYPIKTTEQYLAETKQNCKFGGSYCETDNLFMKDNPEVFDVCVSSNGTEYSDNCFDDTSVIEYSRNDLNPSLTGSAIKNFFTGKAVADSKGLCFQHVVACPDATRCNTKQGKCRSLSVDDLMNVEVVKFINDNDPKKDRIKTIINFYADSGATKADIISRLYKFVDGKDFTKLELKSLDQEEQDIKEVKGFINVLTEKDIKYDNSKIAILQSVISNWNKNTLSVDYIEPTNPESNYALLKYCIPLLKEDIKLDNTVSAVLGKGIKVSLYEQSTYGRSDSLHEGSTKILLKELVYSLQDKESRVGAVKALSYINDIDPNYFNKLDEESLLFYVNNRPDLDPLTVIIYMNKIPLFSKIYSQIGKIYSEDSERASISLAVYRYMIKNPKSDIDYSVKYILDKRKEFENKEIVGPNTYFISFVHNETRFSNIPNKNFAKERGVKEENIIVDDLKGPEKKQTIEQSIVNSKNKGNTIIWINTHGLPNYVCLGGGISVINSPYGDEEVCKGFRYNEFGDLLLNRGKLNEVTLIITSCYSYNFADQLINYLKQKNSDSYPTIIVAANKGKYSYGHVFLDSLESLNLKQDEPLFGKNVFDAEKNSFNEQDSAIFFSKSGKDRPIEISQNYMNHECTGEECVDGVCTASVDVELSCAELDGGVGKVAANACNIPSFDELKKEEVIKKLVQKYGEERVKNVFVTNQKNKLFNKEYILAVADEKTYKFEDIESIVNFIDLSRNYPNTINSEDYKNLYSKILNLDKNKFNTNSNPYMLLVSDILILAQKENTKTIKSRNYDAENVLKLFWLKSNDHSISQYTGRRLYKTAPYFINLYENEINQNKYNFWASLILRKLNSLDILVDVDKNFIRDDFLKTINYGSSSDIEDFLKYYSAVSPQVTTEIMLLIPEFSNIYNNGKLINENTNTKTSISLAVYRFRTENPSWNIEKSIDYIVNKRNEFKKIEIIGSNTYFISFVNQEEMFSNNPLRSYAVDRGASIDISGGEDGLKGPKEKELIKNTIINSKDKGETTIWINVHGAPTRLTLDQTTYFSPAEIGDMLLKRGNLQEVILILDACYSYNFAENLINYLEIEGSKSYPVIITVTNKNRYGRLGLLIESFQGLNKKLDEPLLGKDLLNAESSSFYLQDSGFFFSQTGKDKPVEISQNYMNHECTGEECVDGVCTSEA